MAEIKPYIDRLSPQGQLNSRATADSFGAQIARVKMMNAEAMQNFGQSIQNFGRVAGDIQRRQTEADKNAAHVWATNTALKHQTDFITNLPNMQVDLTDKEFASKQVDDFYNNGMKYADQAPNEYGAEYLSNALQHTQVEVARTVVHKVADENSLFIKNQSAEALKNASNAVSANPSSYEATAQNLDRMVDNLSGISDEAKTALKRGQRVELAKTAAKTEASINPQGFLQRIDAKGGRVTPTGVRGQVPNGGSAKLSAVAAEVGLTPAETQMAVAIFGQESTSGKADTRLPNSKGVIGPMQVQEGTFNGLKRDGLIPQNANFYNPDDTTRAGLALIKDLSRKFGGNVDKVLAAYYSGEKVVNKDGSINTHWRDLSNPKMPTVGQYIAQVKRRMDPLTAAKDMAPAETIPLSDEEIRNATSSVPGWNELDFDDRAALVRYAETQAQSTANNMRPVITNKMDDILAKLSAGYQAPELQNDPMLSKESITTAFGADAAPGLLARLDQMKQISAFIPGLKKLPNAQLVAEVEKMKPDPSAPDFAERQRLYVGLVTTANGIIDDRQKHPAEWMVENQTGGASRSDFTGDVFNDPAQMKTALAARSSMADASIKQYEQDTPLLTDAESTGFLKAFNAKTPDQQVKMLASMRNAFPGDAEGLAKFRKLMGQLTPKSPILAFVSQLTLLPESKTVNGMTATTVASTILQGDRYLRPAEYGLKPQDLQSQRIDQTLFKQAFDTTYPELFKGANFENMANLRDTLRTSVEAYLTATRKTMPSGADVKDAIDTITGGVWQTGGGVFDGLLGHGKSASYLITPWGEDPDKFKDNFQGAAQALLNQTFPEGRARNFNEYWFRSMGDGSYQFMMGDQPMTKPDKSLLKLTEEDVLNYDFLDRAKEQYPFISQYDPQVKISSGAHDMYAETFPPNEEGTPDWPRPKEFPMDKTGIEIYKPDKFGVNDLAGEFLHVDPEAHKARSAIIETLNAKQLDILKSQPDYQDVGGLPEKKRLENVVDALMRGYTVGQWPKEAIDELGLSKKQREILDNLKNYMKTKPSSAFDTNVYTP